MKIFKRILVALLLLVAIAALWNYPKLTIISGYASKNLASTHFIAARPFTDIVANDNNVPLIKLAEIESASAEGVSTSVFGLMKRKTICRDGLGCVLVNADYDTTKQLLKPHRSTSNYDSLPFPYGNNGQSDTIFGNIEYQQLQRAIDGAFANNEIQKTRTVLVAYKGQIVGERYLDGFTAETPILGWSMTKSILATCYAILEYNERLDVARYLPFDGEGESNGSKRAITLDHLLRMQSGLAWDEDYGSISDVTEMLFVDADMTENRHLKSRSRPQQRCGTIPQEPPTCFRALCENSSIHIRRTLIFRTGR